MLAVIICTADHTIINDLYNFNIFVHMDLAIKIFFAESNNNNISICGNRHVAIYFILLKTINFDLIVWILYFIINLTRKVFVLEIVVI